MSPTQQQCSLPGQLDSDNTQGSRPSLVCVNIKDPLALQRCYLPFLRRGGLFVPSLRPYTLRQRLFLILKLPTSPGTPHPGETYAINATVAWLTPAQAQGGGGMGFGLHFDTAEPDLKHSIESLLTALL